MRVVFDNGVETTIGHRNNIKEANKIIYDFLVEKNYKSHYWRTSFIEDEQKWWVDVGSWSEFFYIYLQEVLMQLVVAFLAGMASGVFSVYLFTMLIIKKLEELD